MDSMPNRTQLAEKLYRDKLEKDKNEIKLNTKKSKEQNIKVENLKETIKCTIIKYKTPKKQQN